MFIKVMLPVRNRLIHTDIIPTARWKSTLGRLGKLLGHHVLPFLDAHREQHPTMEELYQVAEVAWDNNSYHVLAEIADKIEIYELIK